MTTHGLQDLLDDAPGSPWHPPAAPDASAGQHGAELPGRFALLTSSDDSQEQRSGAPMWDTVPP